MNRLKNIKQFAGRFYARVIKNLRRWYRRNLYLYHNLYLKQKMPVLVFTPGKVGSTSIYEALPDNVFWLQSHSLNPEIIADKIELMNITNVYVAGIHNYQSLQAYHHIVKPRRYAKYITLVREPIARNISAFFQHKDRLYHFDVNDPGSISKATGQFLNEYPHDHILTWFDVEYKQMLDIDIYQYPFDKEKGYMRLDFDHASIIIMRIDLADDIKESVIADFLNLPDYHIVRANVGTQKSSGTEYKRFTAHVTLPQDYIDRMTNSKYIQHFFSDTEIQNIKAKWQRSSVTESPENAYHTGI